MIVFDNLVQSHVNGVVGQVQRVKALYPSARTYAHQMNAQGSCYRPVDLADVSHRAQQAGKEFRGLFPS